MEYTSGTTGVRLHLKYILGAFWVHLRQTLGTFRVHLKYIRENLTQVYREYTLGTPWFHDFEAVPQIPLIVPCHIISLHVRNLRQNQITLS